MARRDLTRAAEILAGKGGTKGPFRDDKWNSGTVRDTQRPTGWESASALDSLVPPGDGTERNNVSVPPFHHPVGVERGTRGTASDATAGSSCSRCAHVSRYGNCGEAVAAGLAERFGLARHPKDGSGCLVFTHQSTELEVRAARLLTAGAIEPADLELLCERQNAHPAEEWGQLLDWCEAAVRDVAAAGELGAFPVRLLAATGSARSH